MRPGPILQMNTGRQVGMVTLIEIGRSQGKCIEGLEWVKGGEGKSKIQETGTNKIAE